MTQSVRRGDATGVSPLSNYDKEDYTVGVHVHPADLLLHRQTEQRANDRANNRVQWMHFVKYKERETFLHNNIHINSGVNVSH